MCLTTEAFVLFLNIIGSDLVTSQPGRITIHATENDVHWIAVDENWCIDGPDADRKAMFGPRPAR